MATNINVIYINKHQDIASHHSGIIFDLQQLPNSGKRVYHLILLRSDTTFTYTIKDNSDFYMIMIYINRELNDHKPKKIN